MLLTAMQAEIGIVEPTEKLAQNAAMPNLHPRIAAVTDRIIERSKPRRTQYLQQMADQRAHGVNRHNLSCGNLAHGFAASEGDKPTIRAGSAMNIGIVSAYNDMLSAHQPYGRYPEMLKLAARALGASAQVAGGVPAMCDGVTQGQAGMDLSLMSRDNIAQGTAIALSHAMFEGALMLGICDKIVPGMLIGALRFGHLPVIFVPAGPMPSGIANKEKARIRQLYAEGKVGRDELLDAEAASYHAPGTCTFYGTANSNQMLMEIMGLHMPGAAFVAPGTPLRDALNRAAVARLLRIGGDGADYRPLSACVDERAIVNAIVGLMATGGSTNHAIHIPAIARAAGIEVDWQDFADISAHVPLLARVYPNGGADVNHFHAAGGMAFVTRELLDAGLLHGDILTIGGSMADYARAPMLDGDNLVWRDAPQQSGNADILRARATPFATDGGMKLLAGNLGRAVIKVSAVAPDAQNITAPARVFADQNAVLAAFKAGELDGDFVVIVRFQGPRANGMPELHKLTPALSALQDRGHKVALLTDGRMSGASGKVAAAIHLTPEALAGTDGVAGPLARVMDGDLIRISASDGVVEALVDAAHWAARTPAAPPPPSRDGIGTGRELFALQRGHADDAEKGASAMLAAMENLLGQS